MFQNEERAVGGASFAFQLLILCSLGWSAIWLILTVSFLIYKATILPFPPAAFPMEIIASFLVLGVEVIASLIGTKGNLTEDASTIVVSIGLLIVSAVGAFYFMWLQTYVMMLDLAFSAVFFGLILLATLSGLESLRRSLQRLKVPEFIPLAKCGGKKED